MSFVLTTAGGGLQDGPTDSRGSMVSRGVCTRHRKTIDGSFTLYLELLSLFSGNYCFGRIGICSRHRRTTNGLSTFSFDVHCKVLYTSPHPVTIQSIPNPIPLIGYGATSVSDRFKKIWQLLYCIARLRYL